MRILIATHFFSDDLIGGTEVLTLGLAQQLQVAGHEVAVICAGEWETGPDDQIEVTDDFVLGIPVRRLHTNWMKTPDVFRYLYDNPETGEITSDYIQEFKPDVLHITSCYSLSGSIVSAAKSNGIPTILTATDFWFLCGRNTLLKDDYSLCCGPTSAWTCTQCMLSESKIFRITTKVMPERVAAAGFKAIGERPFFTRQRGLRGIHGDWDDRFETLREALNNIDLIVTASDHLRNLLIDYGVPPDRVIASAYGLDSSWATGFTSKTPSSVLRFGFIGQIIPMKGVDILLEAMTTIPQHVELELQIYGDLEKDEEYGDQLRTIIDSDSRIDFRGTFSNDEMGRVLRSIDVLIVPSIWYDFPLVIPSAFATKTPVIATDLPGMNELIEDDTSGFLFDRGDADQLATVMQCLVDNPDTVEKMTSTIPSVKTDVEMASEYVRTYRSLARATNSNMLAVMDAGD